MSITIKSPKEMTRDEKTAYRQIKHAFNWIVGGYENYISDNGLDESEMPSREELAAEIYEGVMKNTYGEGSLSSRPTKEIRFMGTEWIKAHVEHRLTKEGY